MEKDWHLIEEGTQLLLDFKKLQKVVECRENLIPAVAQDITDKEVLVIGYVNAIALQTAMKRKLAVFWSTSRNQLWIKGETSGDYLDLKEVRVNCEQNSLLYLVSLRGEGSCHTINASSGKARFGCFYRKIVGNKLSFII